MGREGEREQERGRQDERTREIGCKKTGTVREGEGGGDKR